MWLMDLASRPAVLDVNSIAPSEALRNFDDSNIVQADLQNLADFNMKGMGKMYTKSPSVWDHLKAKMGLGKAKPKRVFESFGDDDDWLMNL